MGGEETNERAVRTGRLKQIISDCQGKFVVHFVFAI